MSVVKGVQVISSQDGAYASLRPRKWDRSVIVFSEGEEWKCDFVF